MCTGIDSCYTMTMACLSLTSGPLQYNAMLINAIQFNTIKCNRRTILFQYNKKVIQGNTKAMHTQFALFSTALSWWLEKMHRFSIVTMTMAGIVVCPTSHLVQFKFPIGSVKIMCPSSMLWYKYGMTMVGPWWRSTGEANHSSLWRLHKKGFFGISF